MFHRVNKVDTRLRQLASDFPRYLEVFDEEVLYSVSGYSEYYLEAARVRLSLGSVPDAIGDEGFIDLLREALLASGIGVRGTHLVSDDEFRKTILENGHEISCLEDLHIDDPSLDLDAVAPMVWRPIDATRVLENEVALVPSSKVLHLLLPDLIVPMDRLYTRTFFRWPSKRFQARQRALRSRRPWAPATTPTHESSFSPGAAACRGYGGVLCHHPVEWLRRTPRLKAGER